MLAFLSPARLENKKEEICGHAQLLPQHLKNVCFFEVIVLGEEMASLLFVRVSLQDHGIFWNISKCLIAFLDALKSVLFLDSEFFLFARY